MKKKKGKNFKWLIVVCIILLIVELGLFLSSLFFQKKDSLYFDGINAIIKNDNYYIAVGSNNDNDLHYEKAKISIYNSERTKLFEKLYNVGFNSAFFEVCLDNNGFVAVGSYEKTEDEHKDSIRRALIVKYDFDGSVLFEKDFQVLDNTKFTNIKAMDDGYYVTGQSVYKSSRVGTDSGGAILVRYNTNGDMEWYKMVGDAKDGIFNDLCVTDDAVYAVGLSNSNVGTICKFQLDGTLLYQKDVSDCDDIGFSGILPVNQSYYIVGAKQSGQEKGAFLLRISDDGFIEGTQLYEKVPRTRFNRLVFDGEDSIIAIGSITYEKKTSERTAELLNYDGLIVKFHLNMDIISDVSYGDDRDDYFTDIIYDNGSYLVVGYSSYEDGSYLSKFIHYSDALKVLEVE